jgi:hypothetical protein
MTNEEQTELIQTESKRLWKDRGFKWITTAFVILLAIVVFKSVRHHVHLVVCKTNLEYGIGTAMIVYMNDYDSKLPPSGAWNDLLIEYCDVSESVFQCPGSQSEGKISDYSINENLYEDKFWQGDYVGFFESEPGWNQIGDIEIFTFSNHKRKGGCYIKSSFSGVQFVEQEYADRLKWKP